MGSLLCDPANAAQPLQEKQPSQVLCLVPTCTAAALVIPTEGLYSAKWLGITMSMGIHNKELRCIAQNPDGLFLLQRQHSRQLDEDKYFNAG